MPSLFDVITQEINMICALGKNPIEELYDIKKVVIFYLKDEKSSPQYQLKKYYPKIYASLNKKKFEVMQSCITQNLTRKIETKLYINTIDIGFISRIYFHGIKYEDLFRPQQFSVNSLRDSFLEYYLRGICTEKGIEILNKFIPNQ